MSKEHRIFRLGKAPAQPDERNLMFASLAKPIALPDEYDFDVAHKGIPTPMFANDSYGDCVIAGRAHQTIRFEDLEQRAILVISDKEILAEYFRETGGEDNGLVVLKSLTLWRKRGWIACGRRLFIKAFAEVRIVKDEVRAAIYSNVGVGIGLSLPISAQDQIDAGKPWDVISGPDSERGSWGGHYVYISGYTKIGPVCVTWGRKQQMTWAFFLSYCDECYAIFDAKNSPSPVGVDFNKLEDFLRTVSPSGAG